MRKLSTDEMNIHNQLLINENEELTIKIKLLKLKNKQEKHHISFLRLSNIKIDKQIYKLKKNSN